MGRNYKKTLKKPTKIDYTISQGQIGRNPGPTKAQKRVYDLGAASIIPVSQSVCPATPIGSLAPLFPSSYTNRRLTLANTGTLLKEFKRFRERGISRFGVEVAYSLTNALLKEIPPYVNAHGLVSFVVNGQEIEPETLSQLYRVLGVTDAPGLVSARIALQGSRQKSSEPNLYVFLKQADALTHLSLCLPFGDKLALRAYLFSEEASRLVSLEIESTSNVQDQIFEGLMDPSSHCLASLRRLCLRLTGKKGLEVDLLLETLWQRHHWQGVTGPLHVEVVEEVDDEIREKGLQMGITFGEPDIFRHV
ncbi:uncharacterized protein SCHCODRAFT_02676156 [Schizophyllum commune H4-8]|uniref:Uncharacterized protein n=1 Tax=Schizophyllum commune (strain H4-8 / FGSC 9210) TaxID=578458 RepID=D8PZG1_SCHCM|nr:uncharacterized protein SCHCODRAFT_02676156 [Schizophyllum commune H4-8]KAI5896355.1 hypothetical protein SCHCODRAFT_02676156 [Schizophyllum commune H4-8]